MPKMYDKSFGFISSIDFQDYTDFDAGKKVIEIFADIAGHDYQDILQTYVQMKHGKTQLTGLGLGVKTIDMSESDIEDAMESLADKANGKLPSSVGAFTQALTDKATNPSFLSYDAFKSIASGTISDLSDISQSVGNTVINTTKGIEGLSKLKYVLPVGILLAIGYYAYTRGDMLLKVASKKK